MIKVFTLNNNKKIELTKEELEKLLDEAYWEGYHNRKSYWTYATPNYPSYITTCNTTDNTITCSNITDNTITLSTEEISNGTIKI